MFAAAIILLSSAPATLAYTSNVLGLKVYSDGYVFVTQVLTVDSRTTSVQVPLLSSAVSDLVATDQNNSPLSYGFAPGGNNITVYSLGATRVTLRYDTNTLTSKNGTVWTISFSTRYNSTVMLPQLSTLGSISGTPYSINETNSSPEMSIPPGSWKISYGVPLGSTTLTTSNSSSGVPPVGPSGISSADIAGIGGVVAAVAVVGISFMFRRRRRMGPLRDNLRPDDVKVLSFIREKGGKVLEPEIRMKFALPKTSAWRQIKRLERLGYVKVTKIGSQNQIEILKEGNAGA
jgi:uncharacterized membrane protein